MRALFTLLFVFLAAIGPVSAQPGQQAGGDQDLQKNYLYEWTDDSGVVHITDGLGKVPKKYREKARKLEEPKAEEEVGGGQPREATAPAGESGDSGDQNAKHEWQKRMQNAKKRLAAAKLHYLMLKQQREMLLAKYGSPVYAPAADRIDAERIEDQMKEAQKEIDDARNEVEVVIPEEARKAGVPPGWLRD
jgi:hypothetical protein